MNATHFVSVSEKLMLSLQAISVSIKHFFENKHKIYSNQLVARLLKMLDLPFVFPHLVLKIDTLDSSWSLMLCIIA